MTPTKGPKMNILVHYLNIIHMIAPFALIACAVYLLFLLIRRENRRLVRTETYARYHGVSVEEARNILYPK